VPGMDEDDLDDVQAATPNQLHLGLTAIEEIVQTRQFLATAAWHRNGWFEQRLWNWMNMRERNLSEFVFPGGFAIIAPWFKAMRNVLIAAAAALAIGMVSPTAKLWVFGLGLFIAGLQALVQISDNGIAFRSMFYSGVNIPVYAGYGIVYRELSRLLIKCFVVQIPLFIPFVTFCGLLTTLMFNLPWQMGVIAGFKAAILLLGARFIFIVFAFSGGTNDSTRFRVRTLTLFAVVLGLGFTYLGLGIAGFLVPSPVAFIFPVLAVLDAYILFRIYGWFYHANRFDLMNIPRR
jgi:hypothetical protein